MNLAQASQQQQKTSVGIHVGRGLLFLFVMLAVVLSVWGGLAYYESLLSGEVDSLSAQITDERQGMSQDKIDAIVDFQFRMDDIVAEQGSSVDPEKLLGSIEKAILPGIVLSEYSFNDASRKVQMSGEADSFRTVVQEMTILKKMPEIEAISVPSLKHNDKGLIVFSFVIKLGKSV